MSVTTSPHHLSLEERRAIGRAARARLPRKDAGDWNSEGRGHDALRTVLAQNAVRAPDLVPIRHGRMAASPWTYYRGAAAVMAADLASRPQSGLTVQLCGDAHVLNFGLWATPERQLSFDLRDFDETLPGPFEWDLMRMAASLQVLARDAGLTNAREADRAVRAALDGYRGGISQYAEARFLDIWYAQITAEDLLSVVVARRRRGRTSRRGSTSERRSGRTSVRRRSSPRWSTVAFAWSRHRRSAFGMTVPIEPSSMRSGRRTACRCRRSGATSSTGTPWSMSSARWWAWAASGCACTSCCSRAHAETICCFLQVKQAGPSVYEAFLEPSRYPNHGQRVTVGRRFIQSSTDILVGWTTVQGIDFYVRQFRDMKVIPSSEQVTPWLRQFARKCGVVLARAHATTGDAAAIDAYLGKGQAFDAAMVSFASAYALQNQRDHTQLVEAVRDGEIDSAPGW